MKPISKAPKNDSRPNELCPVVAAPRSRIPVRWFTYAALILVTMACAPNYRWSDRSTDHPYGSDFLQEWVGARVILTGHSDSLYQVDRFCALQHDASVTGFTWESVESFPPVYPPMHYALFVPFACIPYRYAAIFWMCLLWGTVFVCAELITRIVRFDLTDEQRNDPRWARGLNALWIAVLLFPAVPLSVMFGQKSLLWLMIVCVTCRLLQQRRDTMAGLVFSLLALKPTLFFFLPWLMLRYGNRRFVLGAAFGCLLIWGSAFAFFPMSTWQGYAETVLHASDYTSNPGYRIDWSCHLMSLVTGLPLAMQSWGKLAVVLPLAIYVLLCVLQPRDPGVGPDLILRGLLGTFLLSPHSYHYDLCLFLVPILWSLVTNVRQCVLAYMLLAFVLSLSTPLANMVPVPWIAITLLGWASYERLRAQGSRWGWREPSTNASFDVRDTGALATPAATHSAGLS